MSRPTQSDLASSAESPAIRNSTRASRTGLSHVHAFGRGAVSSAVRPIVQTIDYYVRAWREYLDRGSRDLPVARPTIALTAHALRDEIVLLGLWARRPVDDLREFDRIEAEVTAALGLYARKGWLAEPSRFFAEPPALTEVTIRSVRATGRRYERIAFDSGYRPHVGEPGRNRWLSYAANNREFALLLRHADDRPWLVCVHGAEMGRAAPISGRFIYAGIADQLVHPREQVLRLWEHWGKPQIVRYRGGHTGFFESRPVQQFVDSAPLQSGLVNGPSTKPESHRSA